MQFVYFDIKERESKDQVVIHNEEDPAMSPVVLWNQLLDQSASVKSKTIVCSSTYFNNYDALLKLFRISDIRIVTIEELCTEQLDKLQILKKMYVQNLITSDPILVCYDTCIPVKGLNLDIILDYYQYKKAKGVYLYTYDDNILSNEIGKHMGKSVAPMLLLDTDYMNSISQPNSCTLINIFEAGIYGLWLPFLPLAVQNGSSLSKGIRLYNSESRDLSINPSSVIGKCQSRIGLIGNPSDGYFGNTISITLDNFYTTVTLVKSAKLHVLPHPISDPLDFDSLSSLHEIFHKNGYTGGLRLLYAALNRFYKEMMERGIYINQTPFTIGYDTTIPRQVGLSGSSSIIIATMRALIEYYSVPLGLFTKPDQIKWALQVETEELGITAGLQDRVVQVLQGCVAMNFDKETIEKTGNGVYSHVDVSLLPPLFLAYCAHPEDISFELTKEIVYLNDYSGVFHSDVKQRWLKGDQQVIEKMNEYPFYLIIFMFLDGRIATLPDQFIEALKSRDEVNMKLAINRNFDLRREIWGDAALGGEDGPNLRMIQIARKHGMAAKFSGSGGAVVIIPGFSYKEEAIEALRQEMEDNQFVLVKVRIYEG